MTRSNPHSFCPESLPSTAVATNAAEIPIASHTGGSGTRQLGSQWACHAAADCESPSSHPASRAGRLQFVNTAINPTGTTSPSRGTMIALADKPENDTR